MPVPMKPNPRVILAFLQDPELLLNSAMHLSVWTLVNVVEAWVSLTTKTCSYLVSTIKRGTPWCSAAVRIGHKVDLPAQIAMWWHCHAAFDHRACARISER